MNNDVKNRMLTDRISYPDLSSTKNKYIKRVALVQSNYIPWKGYFDLINMVDEFILFDDVQYTKRDWRNRNKIKTSNGVSWLTIPVEVKNKYYQKIKDTKISDKKWGKNHWNKIVACYSKAEYFKDYKDLFEEIYTNNEIEYLSQINYKFIKAICEILNITTKISFSSDYGIIEGKTERLIDLCYKVNATEYFSGPSAKNYIEKKNFDEKEIKLNWMDYSGYNEYKQLYPPFDHFVSIIDLIFNEGNKALKFMKSF